MSALILSASILLAPAFAVGDPPEPKYDDTWWRVKLSSKGDAIIADFLTKPPEGDASRYRASAVGYMFLEADPLAEGAPFTSFYNYTMFAESAPDVWDSVINGQLGTVGPNEEMFAFSLLCILTDDMLLAGIQNAAISVKGNGGEALEAATFRLFAGSLLFGELSGPDTEGGLSTLVGNLRGNGKLVDEADLPFDPNPALELPSVSVDALMAERAAAAPPPGAVIDPPFLLGDTWWKMRVWSRGFYWGEESTEIEGVTTEPFTAYVRYSVEPFEDPIYEAIYGAEIWEETAPDTWTKTGDKFDLGIACLELENKAYQGGFFFFGLGYVFASPSHPILESFQNSKFCMKVSEGNGVFGGRMRTYGSTPAGGELALESEGVTTNYAARLKMRGRMIDPANLPFEPDEPEP